MYTACVLISLLDIKKNDIVQNLYKKKIVCVRAYAD